MLWQMLNPIEENAQSVHLDVLGINLLSCGLQVRVLPGAPIWANAVADAQSD